MSDPDYDRHDPGSVRNKFERLLSGAVSKSSIETAAAFAVDHSRDGTVLCKAIRDRMERMERNEPRQRIEKRLHLLHVIDSIVVKEKASEKREFVDEVHKDIEALVSMVLQAVPLERVDKSLFETFDEMIRAVERVVRGWKSKRMFEDSATERMVQQCDLVKREHQQRKAEGDPDVKKILKKMEDDRDKQKKAREEAWQRPVDEPDIAEFEFMWNKVPRYHDGDVDDILSAAEVEALDTQGFHNPRAQCASAEKAFHLLPEALRPRFPTNWDGLHPKENSYFGPDGRPFKGPLKQISDIPLAFQEQAERDRRLPSNFPYPPPSALRPWRGDPNGGISPQFTPPTDGYGPPPVPPFGHGTPPPGLHGPPGLHHGPPGPYPPGPYPGPGFPPPPGMPPFGYPEEPPYGPGPGPGLEAGWEQPGSRDRDPASPVVVPSKRARYYEPEEENFKVERFFDDIRDQPPPPPKIVFVLEDLLSTLDSLDPEERLGLQLASSLKKKREALTHLWREGQFLCNYFAKDFFFRDILRAAAEAPDYGLEPKEDYVLDQDPLSLELAKPGAEHHLAEILRDPNYRNCLLRRHWIADHRYNRMHEILAEDIRNQQTAFLKDLDATLDNQWSSMQDLVESFARAGYELNVISKDPMSVTQAKLSLFRLNSFFKKECIWLPKPNNLPSEDYTYQLSKVDSYWPNSFHVIAPDESIRSQVDVVSKDHCPIKPENVHIVKTKDDIKRLREQFQLPERQ